MNSPAHHASPVQAHASPVAYSGVVPAVGRVPIRALLVLQEGGLQEGGAGWPTG